MRSEDALTLILPHPTKENCEEEQEEEEDNSKKAGSGGDKDIRRRTSALRLFKQIDTTKGLSWYKIGLSKQRPFLSFLTLTLIGFTRCSVAFLRSSNVVRLHFQKFFFSPAVCTMYTMTVRPLPLASSPVTRRYRHRKDLRYARLWSIIAPSSSHRPRASRLQASTPIADVAKALDRQ